MQKEKIHLEGLIVGWSKTLSSHQVPEAKIIECSTIAGDALTHLKKMRPAIISAAGKNAAADFINEMSMVVVAINQYHAIRFKEHYHVTGIVSKTDQTLKRLHKHLNGKVFNYINISSTFIYRLERTKISQCPKEKLQLVAQH